MRRGRRTVRWSRPAVPRSPISLPSESSRAPSCLSASTRRPIRSAHRPPAAHCDRRVCPRACSGTAIRTAEGNAFRRGNKAHHRRAVADHLSSAVAICNRWSNESHRTLARLSDVRLNSPRADVDRTRASAAGRIAADGFNGWSLIEESRRRGPGAEFETKLRTDFLFHRVEPCWQLTRTSP
jgi:hypothetical protein